MSIGFDKMYFHEKTGPKNEQGARFFSFPKEARPCLSLNHNCASRGSKIVPLAKKRENTFFPFLRGTAVTLEKAQPYVSRNEKNKNAFFLSERHGRDSHESTTVPLTEAKPWLLRKEKNRERVFFRFREAQPWLSRKHNRVSRGSKTVTLAEEKNRKHIIFRFREARPCFSRKQNRAARGSKTVTLAKQKKCVFRAKKSSEIVLVQVLRKTGGKPNVEKTWKKII